MSTLKGVIFDFNGTLFWDTPLHNLAWDGFLENHGIRLSDREKNEKIHGKYNQDIFRTLFSRTLSKEEELAFILEKEGIYQQLCLKGDMQLAPGAEDLLGFLHESGIPFTIATASGKENVDFYFRHLGLADYFDPAKVVYNDGSFPGKPRPDIFLKACRILGLEPDEVLVFEDSSTGILAAENASVGRIIIVNSNGEDYSSWDHQVITDFEEVDRGLFI